MALTKITKLPTNTVTSDKIVDNTIVNADISPSAAIADAKTSLPTTSSNITNVCTSLTNSNTQLSTAKTNISLLGFKMAVNESLTIFNLIDGVVDEFHDESGTDESEGSNDLYNATCDFYVNSTQPTGQSLSLSAGFTTSTITEPDTSTSGTDSTPISSGFPNAPAMTTGDSGCGSIGKYTVPSGITSVSVYAWGAGGGKFTGPGGGGGYAAGTLAVTASQSFDIVIGETGHPQTSICTPYSIGQGTPSLGGGGSGANSTPLGNLGGGGGGLSGIFSCNAIPGESLLANGPQVSAPSVYLVAGGGGGAAHSGCASGGAGGGLTGQDGTGSGGGGEGGSQTAGGSSPLPTPGPEAGFLLGSASGRNTSRSPAVSTGAGGGGYYGGGSGGGSGPATAGGGGGSSYYAHPQITSGSTEAGCEAEGGGDAVPLYVAPLSDNGMNIGGPRAACNPAGGDGFVLLTASLPATTTSTTIVSTAFSASSVPTTSRIVVFEENVDTPTLNTDIIASISRDGGSNYTNATLSDSGYVTGSSGQRILTGQATISGQPSGQSMRWKLALANNTVKIHGVSLSWA